VLCVRTAYLFTRPGAGLCLRTAAAFVVVAALLAPRLASAQTPQVDPRWHAWIGCWSSSQNGLTGAASRVCVVPAGTSAVDIITLANGRVASREHVDTNGERRTSQRDGCTGWETARWSNDGRRVYVQSEHQCAAGAKRSSDGLITISPQGDWLDVLSVTMGTNTGVRVLRHRATVEPTDLPADVAATLHTVPSPRVRDARTAAVAPLGIADIVDASHQASAGVVAAWLNDVRQEFSVDAKRLVELADAKVPDRVIDMLVALAYPDAFEVPPSPTTVGALATNESGGARTGFGGLDTFDNLECANDFSVFGFGGCSPYAYSPFGYSPFGYGYLPYSYSRFGYGAFGGFAGAYGGWYDTAPIVVIRPNDAGTHGQVVNGRGYTSGSSGTSTATSSGAGSSSSSGGSSSSEGSSGGSASTPSSGGGDRTAHPR
jgi:hypothetical protein